jgi:hypothetical protein
VREGYAVLLAYHIVSPQLRCLLPFTAPFLSLVDFSCVYLPVKASAFVSFILNSQHFWLADYSGSSQLVAGEHLFLVAEGSLNISLRVLVKRDVILKSATPFPVDAQENK